MEETIPIVRAQADVTIIGLMVSLNRQEKGKGDKGALDEIKELYGFETEAIVSMDEVVEYLYNREIDGNVLIDDEMKAKIDAYYEQYGVAK
jgi:orotate phosphoribosyltransferase